jgi:hypothetical protein
MSVGKSRTPSCSCGQLQVIARDEPVRVSICHCLACQRRTGSAFGVQARFQRRDVSIEGRSSEYRRIADSGNALRFHFCLECGSTVYYLCRCQLSVAPPLGIRVKAPLLGRRAIGCRASRLSSASLPR